MFIHLQLLIFSPLHQHRSRTTPASLRSEWTCFCRCDLSPRSLTHLPEAACPFSATSKFLSHIQQVYHSGSPPALKLMTNQSLLWIRDQTDSFCNRRLTRLRCGRGGAPAQTCTCTHACQRTRAETADKKPIGVSPLWLVLCKAQTNKNCTHTPRHTHARTNTHRAVTEKLSLTSHGC